MKYLLIALAALNLTAQVATANDAIARKKNTKSCPHCKDEKVKNKAAAQKQHDDHGHELHPNDQHDAAGAEGATGGTGAN